MARGEVKNAVYQAVVQHGCLSPKEIADIVGIPRDIVNSVVRMMVKQGILVAIRGKNRWRGLVYCAPETMRDLNESGMVVQTWIRVSLCISLPLDLVTELKNVAREYDMPVSHVIEQMLRSQLRPVENAAYNQHIKSVDVINDNDVEIEKMLINGR